MDVFETTTVLVLPDLAANAVAAAFGTDEMFRTVAANVAADLAEDDRDSDGSGSADDDDSRLQRMKTLATEAEAADIGV